MLAAAKIISSEHATNMLASIVPELDPHQMHAGYQYRLEGRGQYPHTHTLGRAWTFQCGATQFHGCQVVLCHKIRLESVLELSILLTKGEVVK